MKINRIVIVVLAIFFLSGCASIKVYRPLAAKDEEQGIKIFTPKPYIMVARAGEGGKVISVTPVMLPDLADPHFIRQTVGIGKANLTLGVEGGMLKSFGGDVDSKVPETIKEIGALATGYGTLVKTLSEAAKLDEEAGKIRREAVDTANIDAAIALINSASGEIDKIMADNESFNFTDGQKKSLDLINMTLKNIAKSIADPNKDKDQSVLDEYATKLVSAAVEFDKVSANFPKAASDKYPIASISAEVKAAAGKIASKQAAAPVFELYEVDNSKGTTELRKVSIP